MQKKMQVEKDREENKSGQRVANPVLLTALNNQYEKQVDEISALNSLLSKTD